MSQTTSFSEAEINATIQMCCDGASNREIADKLEMSVRQVHNKVSYLRRIGRIPSEANRHASPWEAEETDRFIEDWNDQTQTVGIMAQRFGRSVAALWEKAYRLRAAGENMVSRARASGVVIPPSAPRHPPFHTETPFEDDPRAARQSAGRPIYAPTPWAA